MTADEVARQGAGRRPGRQGGSGWVVGRVAGAPVVLSPGWLVAAVVLTIVLAPVARIALPAGGTVAVHLLAAVVALLLFVSTFLHELAHAVVARRYGIAVHQIALTLLGGHTELGAAASSARVSATVAVAGPVTNLLLGGLAWAVWLALPDGTPLDVLALAAAASNAFVGVLNLLPGLPLDGGRVLEAGVWAMTGSRSTGTTLAAWAGRGLAVAAGVWGLWPVLVGDRPDLGRVLWAAVVGAFVWSGASQALAGARAQERVGALTVRSLMVPAVGLEVGDRVADLDLLGEPVPAVVLLGPGGRPVAWVDPSAAAEVPTALRATTGLVTVAVPLPDGAVVPSVLTGADAVRAVAAVAASTAVLAVVDGSGHVLGLLRTADVVGALHPRT